MPDITAERIELVHGEGGARSRELVEQILVRAFDNPELNRLEDQARIELAGLMSQGDRLAFTTDSYVVEPVEFPGGNIGTLAVNGTLNDLAVGGARPRFLSCGLILEEGLELALLQRVINSMAEAARDAGVAIVTGDTKVVPRGKADKLFINTSGIGVIPTNVDLSAAHCQPGDVILINGFMGDHGAAILQARGELALEANVHTDCQSLHTLVSAMLAVCPDIHAMRDATRGGVATVLSEFAQASSVGICLQESELPVRPQVRGMCEILGLEPLYLANEGKLVAVVPRQSASRVLEAMQRHPAGQHAAIIGQVTAELPGKVQLANAFGSSRLLEPLAGEQLPRIC
ncbi:MAG: hydrogenase expression/formation protein HypE [Marinobacterium sp.]